MGTTFRVCSICKKADFEHKEACKGAKYYEEYYETRDLTGTSAYI